LDKFHRHTQQEDGAITIERSGFVVAEKDSALAWFFLTDILEQLKNKPIESFWCPMKGNRNCKLQDDTCGVLPLKKWPEHPDCWFFITACDIVLFDWDFRK